MAACYDSVWDIPAKYVTTFPLTKSPKQTQLNGDWTRQPNKVEALKINEAQRNSVTKYNEIANNGVAAPTSFK